MPTRRYIAGRGSVRRGSSPQVPSLGRSNGGRQVRPSHGLAREVEKRTGVEHCLIHVQYLRYTLHFA